MATQFQLFVNRELPKRIWIEPPESGNLPADKFLITTGVGLEVKLSDGGGSGGGAVTESVLQIDHGFSILTPIYHNGTQWLKAKADSAETLGTHIVLWINNKDSFVKAMVGTYVIENHGLTPGEYYFVSASIEGGLTNVEPPIFSNPILKVLDESSIMILPYRPSITMKSDGTSIGILFQDMLITITQALVTSKVVTLPYTPLSKSEVILLNGLELSRGSAKDYIISGNTITFNSGSKINVDDELKIRYAVSVI